MVAFAMEKGADPSILSQGESSLVDVKNGKEKKDVEKNLNLDLLMQQLQSLKSAQRIFSGQRKGRPLRANPAVEGLQVVFRPTLCGSTSCKKMQTGSKSFKMCAGCKEDDEWEVKRVYCGKERATKDWKIRHRHEHQTWHMSLVD
jgi:hypothetical protein